MSIGISKSEQTKKNKEEKVPIKKKQRKRCKQCNVLFTPTADFQKNCSKECDFEYIIDPDNLKSLVKEGEDRKIKDNNKKKLAFKQNDKSFLMKKAQDTFNKFIRLRDKDEPCISCPYIWNDPNRFRNQSMKSKSFTVDNRQAHASHYMSVGKAKGLRFNELNVHKSCQICNSHLSGNLVEYRPRLINKIGLEKVEELELLSKSKEPNKYSVEDYKNIIHTYNLKIKELEWQKQ